MFPPPAQVYSPPKKDMSWTGLSEFIDDTISDYSRPSPSIESNLNDLQNSNSSVSKHGESSSTILSKHMIKFIKATDSPGVIKTNKTTRKPPVKYVEMYRNTSKSPNVKDDTITDYSRPSPSIKSNSNDLQNSNSSVSEHEESSSTILSKPMIKFVKAADSPGVIKINKIARKPAIKYDEMYRNTSKSPNVSGQLRDKIRRFTVQNEVADYILQVKKKLLIKKLKYSEAEHQVYGRIVGFKEHLIQET
nr:hypothetical protein [Tanacetum cinerariifolium]